MTQDFAKRIENLPAVVPIVRKFQITFFVRVLFYFSISLEAEIKPTLLGVRSFPLNTK